MTNLRLLTIVCVNAWALAWTLDQEEWIDQVEQRVGGPHAIIDTDGQIVARLGRAFHAHIQEVDARLPTEQGIPHPSLDHPAQSCCIGFENQIVDSAAIFRQHLPFSWGGAQQDPDALADLFRSPLICQPPARSGSGWEVPASADESVFHVSLQSRPYWSRPPCLPGGARGHCRLGQCRQH